MNSSLLENDKQIDDQVIAQVPIWLTEDCIDLSDNRSICDSDWIKYNLSARNVMFKVYSHGKKKKGKYISKGIYNSKAKFCFFKHSIIQVSNLLYDVDTSKLLTNVSPLCATTFLK